MNLYVIIFLILTSLCAPISSHSFNLKIGLENFSPNVGGYQVNTTGETESFSFNPGLKLKTTLRDNIDISTSIFLPETSTDTLYTMTYIKADLKYRTIKTSLMDIYLGIGMYSKIISGSGKNLTLPNGGGSSTFFGPKNTVYNNFLVPECTISIPWAQKLESDFTFMAQDLFDSEKRSWGYFISLNWRII